MGCRPREHSSIRSRPSSSSSRCMKEARQMIFLGIDWAESGHDACLVDEQGGELARARVGDTLEGVGRLQSLVAVHARSPDDVLVTIETPRL